MPALAPSRQRSADRDDLLAAAGQGAHDRGAAADVGAVADDDAGADPALDHRGAERAGVEVHEPLVHDGGALGQVRAEADPVGVGDPHAGGDHVVGHPRELVDAVDAHVAVRSRAAAAGSARSRRPRTGPALVHTTLVSRPKTPSRLSECGATSRWLSRCSRSHASWVSAGPAWRSSTTVSTTARRTPRTSSTPSSCVSSAGASTSPGASRGPGSGTRCRARRPRRPTPANVARPKPHAAVAGGRSQRGSARCRSPVQRYPNGPNPNAPAVRWVRGAT